VATGAELLLHRQETIADSLRCQYTYHEELSHRWERFIRACTTALVGFAPRPSARPLLGKLVHHAFVCLKLMIHAWRTSLAVAEHDRRVHCNRVRWYVPSITAVLGEYES
jgi:hypothetical protein